VSQSALRKTKPAQARTSLWGGIHRIGELLDHCVRSSRSEVFSKIVRNLKSHKNTKPNFIYQGYAQDVPGASTSCASISKSTGSPPYPAGPFRALLATASTEAFADGGSLWKSEPMSDLPSDIRRFETLQLLCIAAGFAHWAAVVGGDYISSIIDVVLMVTLTLLISRARQGWARWILVGLFVLGLAYKALHVQDVLALGYPVVTFAGTVVQAAALAFLFTKASSTWLRRRAVAS
jgi:hypothetical protein